MLYGSQEIKELVLKLDKEVLSKINEDEFSIKMSRREWAALTQLLNGEIVRNYGHWVYPKSPVGPVYCDR